MLITSLIAAFPLGRHQLVDVAGLIWPVDAMEGPYPLEAGLLDQVLHWQIILVGVDADGLDVAQAALEVVDHGPVELGSIAVAGVVGVDGNPVHGHVLVSIDLPRPVQLVIAVVWRRNDGQGAHRFAVVSLGQISVAIGDVFLDMVRVRVVALPLVDSALRQLDAPVLENFHHLVKIRRVCLSNLHPHAFFHYVNAVFGKIMPCI